ncbi:caldesmon-like [Triticum aestivum]|uniref:caldesmon-like n=1 Tax=Triticum aestivum TaxID=4565 RepID=UPI001D0097FD|nr:caldesmon-like [Triticum aestivum]
MQLNEGGLKLLSRNNDTNIIREVVREGYKYLMFYLDHEDNYGGGGWDDAVSNPFTRQREENIVEPSFVVPEENRSEVMYTGDSTCEGTSSGSRRSRRAVVEEEDDEGSWSDSDDSDYNPEELVDSDYDLQDGDEDLVMDESHVADDEKKGKRKGKQVAEDDNSEDEKLEMPESDDEEMKFKFNHFTEEDLHEPKFHVGQVFSSIELIRAAIREYSCKERLGITFGKRKEEAVAKKLEKEEKRKALLQQKQLDAEEKRKAAEERKQKAQQEKEAKKSPGRCQKQAIQAKKKQAEEEKNKRVAERKRIAEQKRKHVEDAHRYEEAQFLLMQEEEHERIQRMREYHRREEEARQQAWEGQVASQRSSEMQGWEEKNKEAEEMRMRNEKERQGNESITGQQNNAKRGNSSQPVGGFNMPRRTSMFDIFRG